MKVRHGNCSSCGKKGIASIRIKSGEYKKAELVMNSDFTLLNYGGKYLCCNDSCYLKVRNSIGQTSIISFT